MIATVAQKELQARVAFLEGQLEAAERAAKTQNEVHEREKKGSCTGKALLGRTRSVRQALKRVCLAIAHRGVKHNVSRHQVPNRPDRPYPDADRDEVVFENNAVVLAWTPSHLFVGSSTAWSQAAQAGGGTSSCGQRTGSYMRRLLTHTAGTRYSHSHGNA